MIPNHDKVYKKISSIKDELVYGGKIDWHIFEDRGRVPIDAYYENDVEDALQRTIKQYKLDRQKGQKNIVEVWTEKDAISGILKKVTLPFGVKLVVNKGYTSSTAIYGAYERFMSEFEEGKSVTILYFGDHDPSGMDMIRDIRDRLTFMFRDGERTQFSEMEEIINKWFYVKDEQEGGETIPDEVYYKYRDNEEAKEGNEEDGFYLDPIRCFFMEFFKVTPIGLTMEQIKEYNPPPNPAKITDPRAKGYIKKYGNTSWEIDALKPDLMRSIVKKSIIENIDPEMYNEVLELEKIDKERIKKMINEIK